MGGGHLPRVSASRGLHAPRRRGGGRTSGGGAPSTPPIALSLVVAVALWGWASPHLDARAVWADLPDTRVAGRHFVVGYTDVAEVRALSRAGLIGGVFLTRRNVEQRSAEAVAAEIGARRDAVPAKGPAAP